MDVEDAEATEVLARLIRGDSNLGPTSHQILSAYEASDTISQVPFLLVNQWRAVDDLIRVNPDASITGERLHAAAERSKAFASRKNNKGELEIRLYREQEGRIKEAKKAAKEKEKQRAEKKMKRKARFLEKRVRFAEIVDSVCDDFENMELE